MRRLPTLVARDEKGPFAVLININARGVNQKVRGAIKGVVPEEHLFISHSPEEADRFAATIIEKRYAGVFSGGGDGSLVMLINMLWKHVIRFNQERSAGTRQPSPAGGRPPENARDSSLQPPDSGLRTPDEPYRFPMLGILKLGTGNGWAGVVGSERGIRQLRRALRGGGLKCTPFDLIECEGRRFHFAGMGYDARVLNDYITFKEWAGRHPTLKRYATTLPGYFVSAFGHSIPVEIYRSVRGRGQPRYKVVNHGRRVFRIEGGGRPVPARFGKGDMIFHGRANIVAAATTTNYGFNLKAFPYAMTMPGMMNLRIVKAAIPEIVANIGPIWEGVYRSPRFIDFLVSDVEVTASIPAPFHIGGDAEGYREHVRFRMAQEPVRVVDFSGD